MIESSENREINAIPDDLCNVKSEFKNDDPDDDPKEFDPTLNLPRLTSAKGQLLNVLEAAEKGQLDLIRQFYRMDPEMINVCDGDGYTPLHRACYNNQTDVVKWLIMHGADVRARTEDGWEPIHSAAQWGRAGIVRILLAYGADINSRTNGGNTPFHLAATRGERNRKLIEYLLFRGGDDVDLDAKNDANDTPFDICKRNSMLYKLWEYYL